MEKIAFVFPGQGAQFIGMGKNIYDRYDIVKKTYEEANNVLGYDIKKICFEGNMLKLNDIENLFPALLTTNVAFYRVYMQEIGVRPQFCTGHSLGEYAALTCAGAINFADALNITHKRGIFAKEILKKIDSGMTIIDGVDQEQVLTCIKNISNPDEVAISCYNAQNQVAISGISGSVQAVEDLVIKENAVGTTITPLFGAAPFHCFCMKEAAVKLDEELNKYKFNTPIYPVISNVTGEIYENADKIKELLVKQMTQPVKWKQTVELFDRYGISMAIEMGPKNVLTNIIERNSKNITCMCFGKKEDRSYLKENIADSRGIFERFINKCIRAAVATKNKNYNDEEYVQGVIKPIGEIRELLESREQNFTTFNKALDLLKIIFTTKHVNKNEQKEWINEIMNETGYIYYALKNEKESDYE